MTSTTPHPVDIAVGQRIRTRRRELKMSQGDLARKLGITFQQVQKYERGANRVSASRLVDVAAAIGVSASILLGEAQADERLATPGAEELLGYYTPMRADQRASILSVAKAVAGGNALEQAAA